ncbi:unnamed protein product, partial [Staurois parvus]
MGHCTASHCCCLHRHTLCHVPLSGLLTLLVGSICHRVLSPHTAGGFHFVIGCCMASHCCCQARNLPWAPVPTPQCCCQARNLSWAPVPPPHAACQV